MFISISCVRLGVNCCYAVDENDGEQGVENGFFAGLLWIGDADIHAMKYVVVKSVGAHLQGARGL